MACGWLISRVAPSVSWLGRDANPAAIRESGLWNVNHVDDACEAEFLERLADLAERQQ
jgi:hypothetical protein